VANVSKMDHVSSARILVVEDQVADLHLIEQVLAAAGFLNVGLSTDPLTVANMFDPARLDLVILDLWMPGLDGFALLRQMRDRIPAGTYLPLLVVTADVSVDTRRRALLAGATDFLTKPIDVVEVTLRVKHLLETRRLQVALFEERSQLESLVDGRTAELAAANTRLSDLVLAKDEFIASVSHELRTPLTGVLGFARELAERLPKLSQEDVASIAKLIVEQSTEAAAIIDDLLVAARADIDTIRVHAERVDIRAEFESVLRTLPAEVTARVELPATTAVAVGDRLRVRQILRNLVGNAYKYGGPHVGVEITPSESVVDVLVSDDGPGVIPEEQVRLFDPFFRGSTSASQTQSIGLGLTVSRRLARLMGGDLVYQPGYGGSAFRLTLPRAL
jgi:signal transduction histidine kinase